jgi:hypothetical protein
VIGTVFAVVVVFAILVVVSRSAGYFRGRMSVVDSEEGSTAEVGRSAALGAGAGVLVLCLLAVLYLGVTQWEWLGRPSSHGAPAVISPVPVVSPPPLSGVSTSASPPAVAASPSPTH